MDTKAAVRVQWPGGAAEFTADQLVRIGRNAASEVVLENANVSRHHAELRYDGGEWRLADVGSTQGIYVDGNRVLGTTVQDSLVAMLGRPELGDRIEITVLAVTPPGETPTIVPAANVTGPHGANGERPAPALHVVHAGRRFTFLSEERVECGRDEDCAIVIANPIVSRHHARFERTSAGWHVVDLGSSSGTFVAGTRVERAVVHDGMELWLAGERTGELIVCSLEAAV